MHYKCANIHNLAITSTNEENEVRLKEKKVVENYRDGNSITGSFSKNSKQRVTGELLRVPPRPPQKGRKDVEKARGRFFLRDRDPLHTYTTATAKSKLVRKERGRYMKSFHERTSACTFVLSTFGRCVINEEKAANANI